MPFAWSVVEHTLYTVLLCAAVLLYRVVGAWRLTSIAATECAEGICGRGAIVPRDQTVAAELRIVGVFGMHRSW